MVVVLTRFARQCANGPMSPRLHASARKHVERDRLTDEAVLYTYEHALNSRPLDDEDDLRRWLVVGLDQSAMVVASRVSLALVARWCFTGASRETQALMSDLVNLPTCLCCSWRGEAMGRVRSSPWW